MFVSAYRCYTAPMTLTADGGFPRFHPLIIEYKGVVAWWVCDGHADTEHSLAAPYIGEPCESYEDALACCGILNEDEQDGD
jgi:hypothetical protein